MKRTKIMVAVAILLLLFSTVAAFAADDVTGLWKVIDDNTGKPNAYVMVYKNDGKVYGRMMATISLKTGLVDDTYATKKFKNTVYVGDPTNCGLDFVYSMTDSGKAWKGKITDPNDGKVYTCTITRQGNKLTVRGSIGPFGRNQTWQLANASELKFDLPNPSTFKPAIPQKK